MRTLGSISISDIPFPVLLRPSIAQTDQPAALLLIDSLILNE